MFPRAGGEMAHLGRRVGELGADAHLTHRAVFGMLDIHDHFPGQVVGVGDGFGQVVDRSGADFVLG